eukprot:6492289-Amphidinium_carterae.1
MSGSRGSHDGGDARAACGHAMATSLGNLAVVNIPRRRQHSQPWDKGGTFQRYWHDGELEYPFMQPATEFDHFVPPQPKATAKVPRLTSQAHVPRTRRTSRTDASAEAAAREALVAEFVRITQFVDEASDIHVHFERSGAGGAQYVMMDILRIKATNTLRLRLHSLTLFIKWFTRVHPGVAVCIPPSEQSVYDYVCCVRDGGFPKTRASKLVDALAFAHVIFGCPGHPWKPTPRILGAMEGIQAKIVTRRSPLTKDALEKLETFVCDETADPALRQVAGYAVFLTHSRSRFSDALHPEAEPVLDTTADGNGFIEVYTKVSKTIKAKAFRGGMLPIVGLAQ